MALKKNHARARYWLWLAASVKFLVPFAVLVAIGTQVGWRAPERVASPDVTRVINAMSHPFTQATLRVTLAGMMREAGRTPAGRRGRTLVSRRAQHHQGIRRDH